MEDAFTERLEARIREYEKEEGAGSGTEQPTNTPSEQQPATTPAEQIPQDTDQVLAWAKEIGYDVTTRDELKPIIDKGRSFDQEIEKYKVFETKSKELEARDAEWSQKFEYLKSLGDPSNLGITEDEQRAFMLRKQRPDLDPTTLVEVMTKDLSKLSPIDVLKMQLKLNDPEIYTTNAHLDAFLADKYGVDFDTQFEEFDELSQTKIKKDAKEAIKELKSLKTEVKLPEKVDIDTFLNSKQTETKEVLAKRSEQWTPAIKDIPKELDKYVITEDGKAIFEYAIDDDFRKSFTDNIDSVTMQAMQMDFNEENRKQMIDLQKEIYFLQNKSKILKAYAAQEVTKRETELKAEYSNVKPANQATEQRKSSQEQSDEQAYEQIRQMVRPF